MLDLTEMHTFLQFNCAYARGTLVTVSIAFRFSSHDSEGCFPTCCMISTRRDTGESL